MRKGINLQRMKAEKELLEQEILQKQKQLKILNDKIKAQCAKADIDFTDHALIRFLERKYELNVKDLKATIITNELIEQIKTLGGKGKFQCDDLTFVINENKIITVY